MTKTAKNAKRKRPKKLKKKAAEGIPVEKVAPPAVVAPEDTTLPIQSPTMLITAPQKHAEVIEGEESEDEDDDDEEEKKDIQYTKEEDSKQEQAQIPQEKKNVTESSIPPSKTTITVSPTKEPGIVSPVVPPVSQQQPIEVPPPPPATPLEKRVRALNEDVRKVTAKKKYNTSMVLLIKNSFKPLLR